MDITKYLNKPFQVKGQQHKVDPFYVINETLQENEKPIYSISRKAFHAKEYEYMGNISRVTNKLISVYSYVFNRRISYPLAIDQMVFAETDIAKIGEELGVSKEEMSGFEKAVNMAHDTIGDKYSEKEIATEMAKLRNTFKEVQ